MQSVEEAEREKPRRARESDDGAGIQEWSGLDHLGDRVHVLLCVKQERRAEREDGFPGKGLSQTADRMIKGHQTDNDVAPPRQEFADEIQAGEYGG